MSKNANYIYPPFEMSNDIIFRGVWGALLTLGTFLYLCRNSEQSMLIRIYNENPNQKHIRQLADLLNEGGIIIYPTDTV
jgi:hypothetical protein